MASPVKDRGSIESTGCGLPTTGILDHQVMANDEVKPVATQNKFQINFTSGMLTKLDNSIDFIR